MKTLLKTTAIILAFITIGVIGCQKDFNSSSTNENKVLTKFNAQNIKEWFYGSFKKSTEWATYKEKVSKSPNWAKFNLSKIGELEAIEFPLTKAKATFAIEGGGLLNPMQCKKIANASLSKIIFIKTPTGIEVREINFIPDWEYLQQKQFDISEIGAATVNKDFTGRVIVKKWDGSIVSSSVFVNGKMKKIVKSNLNNNIPTSNNNNTQICISLQMCIWEQDCTQTIINDVVVSEECGEWVNTGQCWPVEECDGSIDPCEMYGVNCEGEGGGGGTGGGENPPSGDCTNWSESEAQGVLNAVTSETINNQDSESGNESAPDVNGIIRLPTTKSGVGLKLNIILNYSPVWHTKYTGVLFKTSTNAIWKWENFSFNNVQQTSGNMAPCISANISTNISTAISGNQLTAIASGSFSVSLNCSCLFGSAYGSPHVVQLGNNDNFIAQP
jgi:hypothetical protein